MSEHESQRSEQYKRVRDDFEELPFEEKASFLLEAVFATVTRGIERAGKVVSEELETVFKQAQEAAERAAQRAQESDDDGEAKAAAKNGEAGESESESESKGAGAPKRKTSTKSTRKKKG